MTRLTPICALLVALAVPHLGHGEDLIDPDGMQSLIDSQARAADAERGPAASDARPAAGEPMRGVRGQLRAVRHTVLSSGFAGRVDAFDASVGETVAEGDALVQMDCAELQADRAAMNARERAAAARYDVNRRLAQVNNVSGLEVDLSRAELAVARAESRRVAAKMVYCTVAAPFSGVVAAKHVQAYEHVQAGEPLLDLVDNSALRVEVAVPSTWLARLRPEHPFVLRVDELGGRALDGRIVHSEGRVDPVSQTIRLLGEIDGRPDGLLAGMSGPVVLGGPDNAPGNAANNAANNAADIGQ